MMPNVIHQTLFMVSNAAVLGVSVTSQAPAARPQAASVATVQEVQFHIKHSKLPEIMNIFLSGKYHILNYFHVLAQAGAL